MRCEFFGAILAQLGAMFAHASVTRPSTKVHSIFQHCRFWQRAGARGLAIRCGARGISETVCAQRQVPESTRNASKHRRKARFSVHRRGVGGEMIRPVIRRAARRQELQALIRRTRCATDILPNPAQPAPCEAHHDCSQQPQLPPIFLRLRLTKATEKPASNGSSAATSGAAAATRKPRARRLSRSRSRRCPRASSVITSTRPPDVPRRACRHR